MKKDIVLIVGAGASNELNIPTGAGLKAEIISRIDTAKQHNDEEVKNGSGKYIDFINQYFNAKNYSIKELEIINKINDFARGWTIEFGTIDSYLNQFNESNTIQKEIGMISLVYHMIGYEDAIVREDSFNKENNWIKIFIEKHLDEKVECIQDFKNLNLKIITFNYDRIIEHYIFNFLDKKFPNNKHEIAGYLKQDEFIVHVYGKIGALQWENEISYMEFGSKNNNPVHLNNAEKSVDLIRPEICNKKKNLIHDILRNANHVYLLGFGYDEINMGHLNITDLKGTKVIGTAYQLNDDLRKKYENKICLMDNNITCSIFISESFNL